jgi:hypothetical protein
MKSEELQKIHKDMIVTCRGDRKVPPDLFDAIHVRREELYADGDIEKMGELLTKLNTTLETSITSDDSTPSSLNIAILKALDVRKGCGQSLTELFADGPFDGKRHSAPCPACGLVFTWTPALSDEEIAKRDKNFVANLASVLE